MYFFLRFSFNVYLPAITEHEIQPNEKHRKNTIHQYNVIEAMEFSVRYFNTVTDQSNDEGANAFRTTANATRFTFDFWFAIKQIMRAPLF